MKTRSQILILASVLFIVGAGLTLYKYLALGFTLTPGDTETVWQVQGRIQFDAVGGPVKTILSGRRWAMRIRLSLASRRCSSTKLN